MREWVKLLKGDMQLVARGESDADKSKYVSKFAPKKQGGPLLVGEVKFKGIQGFCICC